MKKYVIGGAAALGAAAIFVQQRTRRAERENPPTGRFIEVDRVRLHYVERGQGEPLVMLHGNITMGRELELSGLIDRAAEQYRVIAFDRPGFGYSTRPPDRFWTPTAQAHLFHEAFKLLGVERPILLGHSWSTLVALAYALEYPSHVRGLVLLDGYYYPTVRPEAPPMAMPAVPVVGDLMRYTITPLVYRAMWPLLRRLLFGPPPTPPRFAAFPVWLAFRPSQIRANAMENAFLVPSAAALQRRYHELAMPVALVAGEADRWVSTEYHSRRFQEELPQAELIVVPGTGHMVHHYAQELVMSAVERAAARASA